MPDPRLRISICRQTLELLHDAIVVATYDVSTATNGAGERSGSERTPRGRHEIRVKLGADAPPRAVFAGRRPTGEIATPQLVAAHPERDWITSRILWLRGLEIGRNRGGDVDSMRRFIYIHGTADEDRIGTPASHGCIRMRNDDVIALFDRVDPGTVVDIVD